MKPDEIHEIVTQRLDPKWVGRGDCYIANFELFVQMKNAADLGDKGEVFLCHGILTAPDFYEHMKPGTRFMHAWVEHEHEEYGMTMHDASLGKYSWHTKDVFYGQMKPKSVYRMKKNEANYHLSRTGKIGRWDLLPEHRRVI